MPTKTFRLSGKQMDRSWHVLDAADRPLGRIASDAARLLLGKHKPTYEPFLPMGDFVVVINAEQVAVTGAKTKNKVYYRHTGYPGGLRERTLEEQMERDSTKVLERAIKGMLPHNSHGRELFRHLKVYAGAEHPHEAQVMAGTGARAKKRVRQAEAAAAAPAPAVAPPVEDAVSAEAPATDALSRFKRAELDDEASRLGIEIDSEWKKDDVVAAIQTHYDEHPEPETAAAGEDE